MGVMADETSFDWFHFKHRTFLPLAFHTYVEISSNEAGIEIATKRISDDDLANLCTNPPARKTGTIWRLRLLISHSPHEGGFTFVRYSRKTFEALRDGWHMSDSCLSYCQIPGASRFIPKDDTSTRMGYLFNIISGFKTMLAISNDLEECDTCVVLHCKKDDFEQNFLSTLMTMNSSANLPHNLVFVYITLHIEKAEESFHRSLWSVIYAVQENLGIFAYHKPDQEVDAPDIRDMPTKLTSLDTIATALEMEKKSIAQQIALLVELSDEFDTNHSTGTDVKFRERINILRLRNEHLHERIRETRANLQSMMQMVYAILQQKDNETNHRYAADMRVITAITLVFLPGTFVATLFSASFWNFDPRTTGPMVSGWVWLYFFITLALMLIVLGVWRGYTIIKQSVSTVKEIWHTKRVRRWRVDESEVDDEEGGKKAA